MQFYSKLQKIKVTLENKGHKIILPLTDESYKSEKNIKRKAMEDFNKNLRDSDAILIANFDKESNPNYIGVNALMESGMAFILNKKIFILNSIPENCKDEFQAIRVIELNGNLKKIK